MRCGSQARDEVVEWSCARCVSGVGEEGDKGCPKAGEHRTGVVAEAEGGGFYVDEHVVFLVLQVRRSELVRLRKASLGGGRLT
jgi:hypothetical protein